MARKRYRLSDRAAWWLLPLTLAVWAWVIWQVYWH